MNIDRDVGNAEGENPRLIITPTCELITQCDAGNGYPSSGSLIIVEKHSCELDYIACMYNL